MNMVRTDDELEFLTLYRKADPMRRYQIRAFMDLVGNKDARACEILTQVGRQEIKPEDAFRLLDEYLASDEYVSSLQ